jgi:hypothetical protein
MAVGLAGLVRWRSDAGVRIGLAVPGRPIGPWSPRTGAPESSATGRDRNPEAAHGLLTDCPPPAGMARDSHRGGRASAKCGLVLLGMVGLVGRRDVERAAMTRPWVTGRDR